MIVASEKCECAICALSIDFSIDSHLISELEKHNYVIFAGAGISTETKGAHPSSLYQTLLDEVGSISGADFWELVDTFESQPNGRQKRIQLVKDRF